MSIFGAAIKGFGKALKNKKVKDKISKSAKSAKDFVAIQKKKNKGKADLVKPSGPSKTQVVGFGAAAGAGAAALATIKKLKNKPVKKAMGGEAGESLRKGTIFKEKRDKRRKEVDDMIERLYGPSIKPKPKPKNLDKLRPRPKTKPKKPKVMRPNKKLKGD